MNEQLQIAIAAGILGSLSAVLGAVVQGFMASRQDRLRRLKDETRDAYSKYLTFSTIDAFRRLNNALEWRVGDPKMPANEAITRVGAAYTDIFVSYTDLFMSLSLVASSEVMAAIQREHDNFTGLLSKRRQLIEDAINQVGEGVNMASVRNALPSTLDTVGALSSMAQIRDKVIREMRRDLGFEGLNPK